MNDFDFFSKEWSDQNKKLVFKASKASDYSDELKRIEDGTYIQPIQTGIPQVSPHFNMFYGMLVCFSGYPQAGKSEILRCISVNFVNMGYGKVCIFSPESDTPILISEVKKSFNGDIKRVQENYTFLEIAEEVGMPEIKQMIDEMELQAKEGVKLFIIDPMNWLTSTMYTGNGFEALRLSLTYLKQFAKRTKTVVAYVEHPKTPSANKDGNYPDANVFMISGGTMHNNKCDAIIMMHRFRTGGVDDVVFEVAKLKFQRYLGIPEKVNIQYDWKSGMYY
jgi:predicted ATP-dependent serine protease